MKTLSPSMARVIVTDCRDNPIVTMGDDRPSRPLFVEQNGLKKRGGTPTEREQGMPSSNRAARRGRVKEGRGENRIAIRESQELLIHQRQRGKKER